MITAIGLDHQDFLGDDREAIGREKAGIMRGGMPVVCGDADPPHSVLLAATGLGAPLERIGEDFRVRNLADRLEIRLAEGPVRLPNPALPGVHQATNLATAVAALNRVFPDLARNEASLAKGVSGTRLRGRLERHAADSRILLDVGHNPQAAGVVAKYLSESRRGRCICVLAMLADKQAEAVADRLAGVVDTWICAGLQGPRGQTGKSLAERIAGGAGPGRAWVERDVSGALDRARGIAEKKDTILVFGSFETVAAALRHLE
ncbi:MAG: hypothetical protein GWM87_09385 [Xanthomonadales bacterium]|nr:hypothetical protein [Xanthomonadales bacterium]NIX13120.1 hypothetical protein [Xanthomonadales bacterium]